MKRKFMVILVVLALLISMVGCSGKADEEKAVEKSPESSTETSKSNTEKSATETSDELEEVTLRFYFFGDSREKVQDVWDTISEKYKKELNVKFEIGFIPGSEYSNKLIAMAASGDDYDMNFDGNWLAYSQMVTKGAYLDLTELLPKYAPDLYAKYQELGVLDAASVDGKIVALPWTMSMNQRPYFTFNTKLAKEAGIPIEDGSVKTFEDVDKVLEQFYAKFPKIEGIGEFKAEAIYAKYELVPLNYHNLVYSLKDEKPVVMAFEDTEAYKERAMWAKKWNDAGYISKNAVNEEVDGNVLLGEEMRFSHFTWHEWSKNLGKVVGDNIATTSELYPDMRYGNRSPLSNVVAINANAANPERTLMFLNLLETDQELYDLVHYGIEGETYKLNGTMAEYAVEGMTGANSNYMEWGGQWALWKPQFMRPNATYAEGFWAKEAELAAQEKNVNTPLSSFFPDSSKIQNELAARDQIWELDKLIRYGAVKSADDAVAEMREKQQAAGSAVIVAEIQRQVDEFLAGN